MKIFLVILLITLSLPAHAWKGEDVDNGNPVNISSEDGSISDGAMVVVYTQGSSEEYFSGKVISVYGYGRNVQLEIRDEQFGDRKIFSMQK